MRSAEPRHRPEGWLGVMAAPAFPSCMTRSWNHPMWVLPLLSAAAGYGLRAGDPAAAAPPRQAAARTERSLSLADARAALESVPARFEEEKAQQAERLATLTTGEIQQRLRMLLEERAAIGVANERYMDLRQEQLDLLASLARQDGAAGAGWIQGNLPILRHLFMDAWAHEDAGAALNFVIHTDFPRPCAMSTLMELLDGQAKAGGAALTAAIAQVPWYLFDPSNREDAESLYSVFSGTDLVFDLSKFDFNPGSDEARAVWLESGAARAVAERGVPVDGALRSWFELDPSRALAEWVTWPQVSPGGSSSSNFWMMISDRLATPEGIETLRNSF
ncbi:MAG: hypothetical protein JWO82_3794, partial [Akkermansiaceae bacterium]|nr:hypothetical protein [Akkermansiaceae bacterium]